MHNYVTFFLTIYPPFQIKKDGSIPLSDGLNRLLGNKIIERQLHDIVNIIGRSEIRMNN